MTFHEKKLETNKEITTIQSTTPIQFKSNQTIQQNEVVLVIDAQDGFVFEYANENFKKDKEVALTAVNRHGNVLEYADEILKQDKEVVFAAVKENSRAFAFAHDSIKNEVKKMMETNEKLTKILFNSLWGLVTRIQLIVF